MRTLKYTIVAFGILAGIGFAGYYFIVTAFTNAGQLEKIAEEVTERETQPTIGIFEEKEEHVDLSMTEIEVQIYIHHMTHQHVVADKKWGSVETTPQNIKNLLAIVQSNQDAYEHSDFYIQTLEQWQDGNFNNAVGVHNTIWNWQGGTVGRATDLVNE